MNEDVYLIVTVLSKMVDPSVAAVILVAEATPTVDAAAVEPLLPFFLGRQST